MGGRLLEVEWGLGDTLGKQGVTFISYTEWLVKMQGEARAKEDATCRLLVHVVIAGPYLVSKDASTRSFGSPDQEQDIEPLYSHYQNLRGEGRDA